MKICIPTMGERGMEETVSEHFGGAPYFTIVDLANQGVEVINNHDLHHEHGQCNPLAAIAGKGVESVFCVGIGRGAMERLMDNGLQVYLGDGKTVREMIDCYNNGTLTAALPEQACSGHDCH